MWLPSGDQFGATASSRGAVSGCACLPLMLATQTCAMIPLNPNRVKADAAAVWRDLRVEVVGLVGGLDEGDHEVPVGSVGAHDPDRAQAVIRRAAGEHDVPAVGGVPGLVVAISRRVGSKLALAGSVGVHDPDAAHAIRQVEPDEQDAGPVRRPVGPARRDPAWLVGELGEPGAVGVHRVDLVGHEVGEGDPAGWPAGWRPWQARP